jgi:hypothetical protein
MKGIPVVREDFTKEKIRIAFRPGDRRFEVADAAIRRDPEFIDDISQLWSREIARNRYVKGFFERLRAGRTVPDGEEDDLTEAIDRLYDLKDYPLTALELSPTVGEEQVAEVFVRINSMGTTLNQADFILTLMSVFWDEGRAELEAFARAAREPGSGPGPFNHFIKPSPDQLLRVSVALAFRRARLQHVYSVLRGKDMETGEFSDERRHDQFASLQAAQKETLDLQNWHEFLKCLLRAGYRGHGMISSENAVLYSYALYLIGRRDFHVPLLELREALARWFFMVAVTGRYTDSPETRMEQDLVLLRGTKTSADFLEALDRVVRDAFTEDYWGITLPNELATSAARSPALFAYYAALSLLDARVLFSNLRVSELLDPASRAKRTALERHHLFPKAHLAREGIAAQIETNQIANYALVEWPDNADISDESPAEYFPRFASRYKDRPAELEQMLRWHALPEDWHEMRYNTFLRARQKLMAGIIRDGFARLRGDSGR